MPEQVEERLSNLRYVVHELQSALNSERRVADLEAEIRQLEETIRQLEQALDSRIVIEQAKGVLAVMLDTTPEEAFDASRRAARSRRLGIHAIAADVVADWRRLPEGLERAGA
ncbi:MAG TPA: ANTAR domain-containing protein [Gaiellaceae bacterium]|nr:ANTAR domain-containing protein [Gaiellaceae bacterium]